MPIFLILKTVSRRIEADDVLIKIDMQGILCSYYSANWA